MHFFKFPFPSRPKYKPTDLHLSSSFPNDKRQIPIDRRKKRQIPTYFYQLSLENISSQYVI